MPTNKAEIVRYAVVLEATGVIDRIGVSPRDMVTIQAGTGETAILCPDEMIDDTTHYWDGSAFVPYPVRPTEWHEWDGVQWVDTMTPAKAGELLQARRAAASLPRCDAVLAAVSAGMIPAAEAGEAARGQIPPSLAAIFSALPTEMQLEAEVRWSGSTVIERANPILSALAQAQGITEAQLDALFGVEPVTLQP